MNSTYVHSMKAKIYTVYTRFNLRKSLNMHVITKYYYTGLYKC